MVSNFCWHSIIYCQRFKEKRIKLQPGMSTVKEHHFDGFHFYQLLSRIIVHLMGDPQSPKVKSVSCLGAFTFNFSSMYSTLSINLNKCGFKLEIGIYHLLSKIIILLAFIFVSCWAGLLFILMGEPNRRRLDTIFETM